MNILNLYGTSLENDYKMNATLKNVLQFMISNNGNMPKAESQDEKERKLAKEMAKLKEAGLIDSKFEEIDEDSRSVLHNPTKILYEIITKNYKTTKSKEAILRCVQFFNQNGRRPLINSTNEEEKELAESFQKQCVEVLTPEQLSSVNRLFNSTKNLKNACAQYIKNIKSKEEREETK